MKRINIFLLMASLITFAACDKIESDKYVNHAGVTGQWYDDIQTLTDKSQRVYFEKFTGCLCKNCPDADKKITTAINTYGDKLVVVTIHPLDNAYTRPYPDEPDLRSEDGKVWAEEFDVNALPIAVANRIFPKFEPNVDVDSSIRANINKPCTIAVATECQRSTEDSLLATVHLEFLRDCPDELNVTIFVMEDNILTTQRQSVGGDILNYAQNHVLRKVVTPIWGAPVDADGKNGTRRFATFGFKASSDWNLANCHIVAFVSNRASKEVINVAECDIR